MIRKVQAFFAIAAPPGALLLLRPAVPSIRVPLLTRTTTITQFGPAEHDGVMMSADWAFQPVYNFKVE